MKNPMMTATTNPPNWSANAAAFVDAAANKLVYLAMRWMDEAEYEDIADYQAALQTIGDRHSIKIEKMTKRPFGCVFTTDGRTYRFHVIRNGVKYQRIG